MLSSFHQTLTIQLTITSLLSLLSLPILAIEQDNEATWLIRTSAKDSRATSSPTQRIIYQFLDGDVLIASTSPSQWAQQASASADYIERAATLNQTDVFASSAHIQDHLINDNVDDIANRQCDQVNIAVIDSGADLLHSGWGSTQFIHPWDTITDSDQMRDGFGHGTHVTGIIASQYYHSDTGNIEGVCDSATIIPIRFLSDFGSGTIVNSIEAIQRAIDSGADIINHSWTTSSESTALKEVIVDASRRGILQIAAAGNAGSNNDQGRVYPANYSATLSNMIAVSNWDQSAQQLNQASNYGQVNVTLAASGTHIASLKPNNDVAILSGTSMATPVVTGTAAIIKQQNPSLSAEQINARLQQSVKQESSLNGKTVSAGRLDANGALTLTELSPQLLSINNSTDALIGSGVQLTDIEQWQFRPASLMQSQPINLNPLTVEENSITFEQTELPYGYIEGLTQGEVISSLPYHSTLHAPSELSAAPIGDDYLIQWRGSIWATSFELQVATNGRFRTIATIDAPNNQYRYTANGETPTFRLRARYDIKFDSVPAMVRYSDYGQEITPSPTSNIQIHRLATTPQHSSARFVLDLDSSEPYTLIEDRDHKVKALVGHHIELDTQELGTWSFTLQQNDHHKTLSFTVSDIPAWQLRTSQGAEYQIDSDQQTILGVSELSDNQIAISLAAAEQASLISLTLQNQQQLISDASIQVTDSASATWQSVSQTHHQINLLLQSTTPSTLIIQPTVHSNQASASDSRCFVASSLYADEPHKLTQLRAFRDNVIKPLPGGDWLIAKYYQYSPYWVEWSKLHPKITQLTKRAMDWFIE